MKEIKKPDRQKKPNWFTKGAADIQDDKLNTAMNDPRTTKIITGVIIALILVYIIYTAIPKKSDGSETETDTAVSETEQTIKDTAENTNVNISEYVNPMFNQVDENMPLSDGYDATVSGRIVLDTPDGKNAMLIWLPSGYGVAKKNTIMNSIQMKPNGTDTGVTGNEPITITWDNPPIHPDMFKILLDEGYINMLDHSPDRRNEFEQWDYTVVDQYNYRSSDTKTSRVVIIYGIKIPYDDEIEITESWYAYVLEQASTRVYPCIIVNYESLKNMLNYRYPDFPSIARAILVPADGEPEWKPGSFENSVNHKHTVPDNTEYSDDPDTTDDPDGPSGSDIPIIDDDPDA